MKATGGKTSVGCISVSIETIWETNLNIIKKTIVKTY